MCKSRKTERSVHSSESEITGNFETLNCSPLFQETTEYNCRLRQYDKVLNEVANLNFIIAIIESLGLNDLFDYLENNTTSLQSLEPKGSLFRNRYSWKSVFYINNMEFQTDKKLISMNKS